MNRKLNAFLIQILPINCWVRKSCAPHSTLWANKNSRIELQISANKYRYRLTSDSDSICSISAMKISKIYNIGSLPLQVYKLTINHHRQKIASLPYFIFPKTKCIYRIINKHQWQNNAIHSLVSSAYFYLQISPNEPPTLKVFPFFKCKYLLTYFIFGTRGT